MRQTGSPKTLILGLGNPLSGDDGFGAGVLDFLRHEGMESMPDVALVDAHTDLLNHLEEFAEYDLILLIDAILDPDNKLGQPGRIVALREKEFLHWSEASSSVHQMSPMLAVKLFRQLYPENRSRIFLIGLVVDQLTRDLRYATQERIRLAAAAIKNLPDD
ncbi:MAG: hydrogenase maturation protease [Acidobacteria bacterium]|nr:hydrogenase maturation protease [Acidobacteriota bacterium]